MLVEVLEYSLYLQCIDGRNKEKRREANIARAVDTAVQVAAQESASQAAPAASTAATPGATVTEAIKAIVKVLLVITRQIQMSQAPSALSVLKKPENLQQQI